MNINNMNLYLLTQDEVTGYDTYDSVVVAAESEEEAKGIHPCAILGWRSSGDWCKIEDVQVELIGEAKKGTQSGVILASFNAG